MTTKHEEETREGSALGRREFIRAGVMGGLAAVAANALERTAVEASSAPSSFELEEATVAQLQQWMSSGRRSAREIAEDYLERVEKIDRRGPSVNSVIETNPDALNIAAALDRERKAGRVRGPLHGVPVLIKDNIDTADRMMTTAGSLALVGARPQRDAFVVQRLRDAGAVLIGKTNLSEWANFRSTHSTSGWSARGGQTLNPYALDRNPCGSSSGSGAAVAANLALAAVGTETDGSIVCPSSACGVVGIKPTLGLVSRSGIIPIAHSQDTAGPMARTVRDAAILLGVLAGVDPRDAATNAGRNRSHTDYTRFLDADGLRGARIGVARKFFGFNDKVDALMKDALDVLKRSGAVIIDPADIPTHGQFDASEFDVLLYEFKADLNNYLASLPPGAHPRTLKALIEFNERHRDKEMPYFGQEIFIKAEAKGPLTERAYSLALAKNLRLSRAQGIDAVMTKHRLDAIVAPTGGPAWTTDLVNGDHFTGGSSTPAAVAGYPNITVPAGHVAGPRRPLLLRPRLRRTHPHQTRLRLRASDEAPPPPALPPPRRPERTHLTRPELAAGRLLIGEDGRRITLGATHMIQTLEAVIDEQGNVRLLESITLPATRRALVTILEEEPAAAVSETALLSEQALAEDWNRPEEDEAWRHLQQAR